MAGLLEKDVRLLLRRKQTLILFVVISLVMGMSMDGAFVVGYITILCSVYSLSTLSFDEAENGFLFLMTLPVERKTYVYAKYVLCTAAGVLAWMFSLVLLFVLGAVKGITLNPAEELLGATVFIMFLLLFLDLMLPLQLKFGMEKGRIILFVAAGGIAAIASVILMQTDAPSWVAPLVETLDRTSPAVFALAGIAITLLATAVSVFCSVHIMENKEF
ncbi:MAG: ABC-2 transporter permease [Clostridiales bacterium]|nr:ABC-2 transporter permease [Candidatus Blautia equi]